LSDVVSCIGLRGEKSWPGFGCGIPAWSFIHGMTVSQSIGAPACPSRMM
jgi:hypothetical protein